MSNEIKIYDDKVEIIKIEKLKPRHGNTNYHPQEQLERLAEIYKYQGFRNPIIVSKQSNQIVCGTGRYLAAVRAGLKQIPVIFQDYESDEQEYAHHVSDNGLSLWSDLSLSEINMKLPDLGPDFDIDMLGLKNFSLDFNDKEFDPSGGDDESGDKKVKRCPHCNEIL